MSARKQVDLDRELEQFRKRARRQYRETRDAVLFEALMGYRCPKRVSRRKR